MQVLVLKFQIMNGTKRSYRSLLLLFFFGLTLNLSAQTYSGPKEDIDAILKKIKAFSASYEKGDYDAIAAAYCTDGRIFPTGAEIIQGREKIRERWVLPENIKILSHKLLPEEIRISGDHAYDFGYYEVTRKKDGIEESYRGKYVVIWHREEGEWRMHLDIWNNVKSDRK